MVLLVTVPVIVDAARAAVAAVDAKKARERRAFRNACTAKDKAERLGVGIMKWADNKRIRHVERGYRSNDPNGPMSRTTDDPNKQKARSTRAVVWSYHSRLGAERFVNTIRPPGAHKL
jgi:hypothetical protein